jgi:hypothetical protein
MSMWSEFKTFKIRFKSRVDFGKFFMMFGSNVEWRTELQIVDVGRSDMVLAFDSDSDRKKVQAKLDADGFEYELI